MNAQEIIITEEEYEEFLDDLFEDVNVVGYLYSPGRALRLLDPSRGMLQGRQLTSSGPSRNSRRTRPRRNSSPPQGLLSNKNDE